MTPVMQTVSKSQFKARALEYFRGVEKTGEPIVVTDRGKPTIKLIPYREDVDDPRSELRDSVIRYEAPLEPVATDDWEALE